MNDIKVSAKHFQNRITSTLDVGVFRLPRCSMLNVQCSYLFLFSALLLLTAIAGCGKKAMPSPPGAQPVPAVSDLSHEIAEDGVRLEWSVPTDFAGGEAIVSRAAMKLSDDMCEGCPLVFQQVAALRIHPLRSAFKQAYRDSPAPGYRYTYRVVLKTDNGRTGGASNLVTFDYGPE